MSRHVIALFVGLAFAANGAQASVEQIRLHVQGLACPFCVFGIERNLKKLPGVASVETTIRTGIVRMETRAGTPIEPGRIKQAVADSGFTLDRIEVVITGRLASHEGRPALVSEEGRQTFFLVQSNGERTFSALSVETLENLKKASADGAHPLTITGQIHDHLGMPPALSVESFEVSR